MDRKRRPAPPAANISCRALVGRRNSSAVRALPMAMSTDAVCTLSSLTKFDSEPVVSTMAIATFQLFFLASASAAAIAFLAPSAEIGAPYGDGGVGAGAAGACWAAAPPMIDVAALAATATPAATPRPLRNVLRSNACFILRFLHP